MKGETTLGGGGGGSDEWMCICVWNMMLDYFFMVCCVLCVMKRTAIQLDRY